MSGLRGIGTEKCPKCCIILNGVAFSDFRYCKEHDPDNVTSLRAEVERLKSEKDHYAEMAGHSGAIIRERDEAQADKGRYQEAWARRFGTDDPELAFQGLIKSDIEQRALLDRLRQAEDERDSSNAMAARHVEAAHKLHEQLERAEKIGDKLSRLAVMHACKGKNCEIPDVVAAWMEKLP